MAPARTPLAVACIVLGAVVLLAGALLSDAARLLRADVFADRVAASLSDERVAVVAAEQLTEAVLAQRRDLTAVRPLLLSASKDVVGSDAFRGLVRTAARRAHAALFSRTGQSIVLSIPDLEVVLRSALAGSPGLGGTLPDQVGLRLASVSEHPVTRATLVAMQWGLSIARYAWLALALGTLLVVGGVFLMRDRRDALVAAGAALIAVGLALYAVQPVGEAIVARLADSPRASGALAGLWRVALAGVPRWGLMFGGIGVVLAAAGSSLLERLDLSDMATRLRDVVVAPRRDRVRFARGVAFVAAGLLVVAFPQPVLALLMVGAGLLLAFVGVREVFAVVLHAAPAHARLGRAFAASGEGWAVGGALVLLLAAAFVGVIAAVNRGGADAGVPTTIDACNGAAALCERRLDEVTFAGTHNAMASADRPDWLFPQQERGIAAQLDEGVRALLIDVHWATPVGGRVRTDLEGEARRAEAARLLGPEGFEAAMRIRDRLVGGAEGPRALYLCHAFCELGAWRADSAFAAIREFLVQHPNEVVLLVVEDHVPARDLARALEASGLAALAYRGAPKGPDARWPTLRELVARDERLVVFIESGAPGVPWLLPAFGVMQETPYTFRAPGDTLSCAPNRGGTGGSLLLVNHWIETTPAPRPSNAARVNALPVLVERARRCERARDRQPTILAVDFYRTGDLLRATRVLNGLSMGGLTAAGP